MKELWLVRHAKSSWSNPVLSDHDRPLNTRGKKDAPFMAEFLMTQHSIPEIMMTSTAKRAKKTASAFRKQFKISKSAVVKVAELYHAATQDVIQQIHQLDEDLGSAAFFCHNPGITDAVNELCASTIDNVPTCGVAVIQSSADYWSTFEAHDCELIGFYYPKMFGQ